ncbi:unnamed protein product [Orchesella dallaii]|uniref:Carboxylic ester hydrolase n=1 Tax=Orchesella dallaii TaxID=48710 RepID=A0ABP1R703_9HEXA
MASSNINVIKFILIILSVVHCEKFDGSSATTWAQSQDPSSTTTQNRVVSVTQGLVEGMTLISRLGKEYYGFKAIKYARVRQRFESPEKPDSWEGVFHANETASPCFQFNIVTKRYVGVEDCLTLDIYTPKLDGSLPVAFWIHPGGFQVGSGTAFEGKYFADASAVLVTINYRLGAFGFLNTEDGQVLGNMGLKDQVKALEWVKENIKNFGGDPSKVMIFGDSAGGASVQYHMLSPRSTGLFSTAYSQSGSALNPWAFQRNPRKNALLLAENAECGKTYAQIVIPDVECLRLKTTREIGEAQFKFRTLPYEFDVLSMVFVPSVEIPTAKAFLSDSPYKIISSNNVKNKVPWLISAAKEEGLFWTTPYLDNTSLVQKLNNEWVKVAPKIFSYDDVLSESEKVAKSKIIKKFYLNDKEINSTTRREVSDIYADRFFLNGILESIILHQQKPSAESPIYIGVLTYPGIYSVIQYFFNVTKFYGTTHSDINQYLFNRTFGSPELKAGTLEGNFSANLIQLLVSFAKNG